MSAGPSSSTKAPKLLDQVWAKLRLLHHARRTEDAYAYWIKRYIS